MFYYLHKRIKKERLIKQDIRDLVKNQQQLKELENRVELYADFIKEQQLQKQQQLEQEIDSLQDKCSGLKSLYYKL
jgi:hypothetical protein